MGKQPSALGPSELLGGRKSLGMCTVYQVYPDTGRGLLAQFVSLSAAGSASSPESDPLPEPKACVGILNFTTFTSHGSR